MIKSTASNDNIIDFEQKFQINGMTNQLVKSALKAITIVIDNEIPSTDQEIAHLFIVMTKLSQCQKKKDDIEFRVTLKEAEGCALWHCCNMVLKNKMTLNQGHQANMCQVMSKMAPELDRIATLKKGPAILLEK